MLEHVRHRVAEVRLDGGRSGLAIVALEGVDDLAVLGDREAAAAAVEQNFRDAMPGILERLG